ncbi:unnamed protein product [Didymodactylos carnosus]|uniref:NAD(+)--protein-arginine ADP-ribosyltransferase n=2 Tax=Didymodactylos carnosus TaxID=1234261 RepID=A0A814Z2S1_9BILA|nr:unnamed protein product [Didymodactylos carnosus]CAF4000517.1 unnamed protein product [Didymodactylos carnosus]
MASTSKSSSSTKKTTTSSVDAPSKFYFACRNNELDAVTSLLKTASLDEINRLEPNGSTPLHAAAYYGNNDIVKLLLDHGASRTIKNKYDYTPHDEAKTDDTKRLFQRITEQNRFIGHTGPIEWIYVDDDPEAYASFNRKSLMKCKSDADFNRLATGIQKSYIDGKLADGHKISHIQWLFEQAVKENDPRYVVKAYTAETVFYVRLNTDLAMMEKYWSGDKHERHVASIFTFHPAFEPYQFTGETYRGVKMSDSDLKQYIVGSEFMNKTFLSTSKDRSNAEKFMNDFNPRRNALNELIKHSVLCKYVIKYPTTALAIEDLSEYPNEKEVLILPYASFVVKQLQNPSKKGEVIKIEMEEKEPTKYTTVHKSKLVQKSSSKSKPDEPELFDTATYKKIFKDAKETKSGATTSNIDPSDMAKLYQSCADEKLKEFGKMETGNFNLSAYHHQSYSTTSTGTGKDNVNKLLKDMGFASSDSDNEEV